MLVYGGLHNLYLCHVRKSLCKIGRHSFMSYSNAKITMANKIFGIYLVLGFLLALINAQNTVDTLVLVDNLAIRETHSIFFKGLQGKKCR